MEMISICQEMGWSYQEYMMQPKPFIASLQDKMQLDSKERTKELNKIKQ